jgi:hypothetical protein
MKKIPIPPEVAEELLRILFEEIGRDGVIDEQERLLFFAFAGRLPVSRERFNIIRQEAKKELKVMPDSGGADLQTLKSRIGDCLKTHLSVAQYRDFATPLLDILQAAFLSVSENVSKPLPPFPDRGGALKSKVTERKNEQTKDRTPAHYVDRPSLPSAERLSVVSSGLDDEYMEMLVDISRMELEAELDDFRKRLIREKAKMEALRRRDRWGLEGLVSGSFTGALIGLVILYTAPDDGGFFTGLKVILIPFFIFFLYKYMAFFQKFSGYAILPHTPDQIKMAFSFLFSVFVILLSPLCLFFIFVIFGGTLGAYVGENKAIVEEEELCNNLIREYGDYTLEPRDVLRFWNLRLQNYIREQIRVVQFRSGEAKRGVEKSLGLIADMKETGVLEKDSRIKTLYARIAKLEKLQTDSEKVLLILAEVENSFIKIIEELHILCEKQAKIDGGDYAEDALQARYKNLLGETDSCLRQWEGEKQEIATDLASLMQSFRREFLNARDFVKAQLELAKRD